MQADPDKWDDSELIAAVRRGLENLDAGAAAEDEDEMAEADARFAALLEAPVPATTPATAASPVKDPTVGEYGEWEPVQRPPPAAAKAWAKAWPGCGRSSATASFNGWSSWGPVFRRRSPPSGGFGPAPI